jgi:hypothetical protein
MSVLHFFRDFVSSNTGETSKPELKPFLTIFGTGMRAQGDFFRFFFHEPQTPEKPQKISSLSKNPQKKQENPC